MTQVSVNDSYTIEVSEFTRTLLYSEAIMYAFLHCENNNKDWRLPTMQERSAMHDAYICPEDRSDWYMCSDDVVDIVAGRRHRYWMHTVRLVRTIQKDPAARI